MVAKNPCRYCFGGITDNYDGYLNDDHYELLGGPCDYCPPGEAWAEGLEAMLADELEEEK